MVNLRMAEQIESGKALDVRAIGEEVSPGVFRLREFVDNVDYCDAQNEEWIWSIGKHVETGAIMAATTPRFYQNAAFECLWLR